MNYQIYIGKKAIKALEGLRYSDYDRIKNAIRNLASNPKPYGCKKLTGRPGYRIRQGDYRIIYDICEADRSVEVLAIGHRSNIYN